MSQWVANRIFGLISLELMRYPVEEILRSSTVPDGPKQRSSGNIAVDESEPFLTLYAAIVPDMDYL